MIYYQVTVDLTFVENLTPEFSHTFTVEVDDKRFFDARFPGQSLSVIQRDEHMKTATSDLAWEFLVSSNLTSHQMIAAPKSTKVPAKAESMPSRNPDATKDGMKLWHHNSPKD